VEARGCVITQRRIVILAGKLGEPIGAQIQSILRRDQHYRVDLLHLNERPAVVPELIIPILTLSELRDETLLSKLNAQHADVPVVAVVDGDDPNQFDSLCRWSSDFLVSPLREPEVHARIRRVLGPEIEAERPAPDPSDLPQLVGEDPFFVTVKQKIRCVAQSDGTTLIVGETGTGKELCARAIHYLSPRAAKPFLPVNCGAIPIDLFERELFGHHKGAFTGAWTAQAGLIAEAEGGTLFLDEIETLSMGAQVKLLRFLQDQSYCVLGSPKIRRANVRIIASTNIELRDLMQLGTFRQDLLYRLAVLVIDVPPLRQRPADVPLLARHFLKIYDRENGRERKSLSARAMEHLSRYSWPGNVRELENVIQRVVVLTESRVIDTKDLPIARPADHGMSPCSFKQAKADAVRQFERSYITALLCKHHGNITRAAEEARKERRAFGRLVKKHQVRIDT
jgi:DNA-binding NtrC family response regulator